MPPELKPIYLFADSSLLFWREDGLLFLDSIRNRIERPNPRAAYVGAANGDQPEYYEIFEAAMDAIGIAERRMILSSFPDSDRRSIGEADVILLAGGDFERGWKTIKETGLSDIIARRYLEGVILIGVSAGAMHLGLAGWPEGGDGDLIESLGLVPFIVSAHDEKNEWEQLKLSVQRAGGLSVGLGIPSGAGAAYHADGSLEPIRRPLIEISARGAASVERLLFPGVPRNVIESDAVN